MNEIRRSAQHETWKQLFLSIFRVILSQMPENFEIYFCFYRRYQNKLEFFFYFHPFRISSLFFFSINFSRFRFSSEILKKNTAWNGSNDLIRLKSFHIHNLFIDRGRKAVEMMKFHNKLFNIFFFLK